MEKCDVYLWENKIGTLREFKGSIYFQFDKGCEYNISPIIFEDTNSNEIHNFTHLDFNKGLAGVFADALPDKNGTNLMDRYFEKNSLKPNVIDRLLFIGESAMGALKFRPNLYSSKDIKTYDSIKTTKDIYNMSKQILKGNYNVNEYHHNYLQSNASPGGARAKAIMMYNPTNNLCKIYKNTKHEKLPTGYIHSLIKFDELDINTNLKNTDNIRIEYAYSQLAKKCDINIPNTYLTKDFGDGKRHFVIERFDNKDGVSLHQHSLAGLYNHNYSDVMNSDNIFRVGFFLNIDKSEFEQIFKRIVFNYVFRNQDDHAKNFSFLMDQNSNWSFSPVYDLMYNNGKKFTYENRMLYNNKLASDVTIKDFEQIAQKFKIDNFQNIIEQIQDISSKYLKNMLKDQNIQNEAIEEIIKSQRFLLKSKNNKFKERF